VPCWLRASSARWSCRRRRTTPTSAASTHRTVPTPAWAACGGEWVAREDARLNAAWKRLYAASGSATKKDLLEEQRAWNAFKDKACQFYANGDFGREGQVLHFPSCRAELIARRIATLDSYGADRR
jgi:uncharacterized protein YecT (DUF1311 family)